MTKNNSRRSSNAGSAHVSSPRENDPEILPEEPRQTVEAALDTHQSTSSVVESGKPVDVDVPEVRAAESQPMTASSSTSSHPSGNEVNGNGTGAAAPYGTRSRNRGGAARPNYAEDKELDAEFEITPPAKDNNGRRAARWAEIGSTSTFEGGKSVARAARKDHGFEPDQIGVIQNIYKDPIPGTSTFSANPETTFTTQPSKKRKAAAQSSSINFQTQMDGAMQISLAQAVTRGAAMAAQVPFGFRNSNMLSFDGCGSRLQDGKLFADDGTVLEVNDHVYLVCEPPGEPYYLGRIMEFLHVNNDSKQTIDALRLNWYYRPKDIGRKVNDFRQVFASMHSDISPLTALRGKCQIKHKSEVAKLDDYRRMNDCFWYEKLYDRYIHRYYDIIPSSNVINVPEEVKKVLDERWRFIVVEPGRGKELTSAVKSCKRCNKYSANNDSVDCAVCRNTYHMSCVSPPLLKKPSRGFAWACGPCSKAQEKKLEARNTPNVNSSGVDGDDEELGDEEDDSAGTLGDPPDTGRSSPARSAEDELSVHTGTAEQIRQTSQWLYRYLGIHCRVEDVLDYDDRIYPRASSRLGPRHQANVTMWPGRPVEYVKPTDIKRKYAKGGGYKKNVQLSKETIAAIEADKIARDKRPKWIQDEPPGYHHRGDDFDNNDSRNTAKLLFKIPEVGELSTMPERGMEESGSEHLSMEEREQLVGEYMERAKMLAKPLGLPDHSTNLLDVALEKLQANAFDTEKALSELSTADFKLFKEPNLSPAELKKFEDGVSKHGSEWYLIKKHAKTISAANVVRFYYTWKKTDRGKQVWGNYSGRKGKKEAKKVEASAVKLQDDVAHEHDDSAFDNDKALEKKRGFQCKFCTTRSSRQWRRAPHTAAGTMISDNPNGKTTGKDKSAQLMVALCRRCAELWRRYAIQWEDVEEAKKALQSTGRAWKRKIDEERIHELLAADESANHAESLSFPANTPAGATPTPLMNGQVGTEPPRKKTKNTSDKDAGEMALESGGSVAAGQSKRKPAMEKPAPPPPPPEPPKPKVLPCAICGEMEPTEPTGDQHLCCRECRLTVHRTCYGVVGENRSPGKWVCDMCSNDKNPQVSVQYKCMLCPVLYTEHDFVELPPKTTTKKKTEKDKERDRIERENAQNVADFFHKKQEEMNKPVRPREPLKRTANNNWVHVTCAVFTPEVKFGNAKAMELSEGIPSIPSARYNEVCKACKQKGGACVSCHTCRASIHVGCAHQAGYVLGFDVAPVKGSRRDQTPIVSINGETGAMSAAIWCKEHQPTKTVVHSIHEIGEGGLTALQLYVQNFKQADLTLTGTVRKANLVNQSTKVPNPASTAAPANRRASTTTIANGNSHNGRGSISHVKVEGEDTSRRVSLNGTERSCITCGIEVSPKWWPCPPMGEHSTVPSTHSQILNGDTTYLNELPQVNGHAPQSSTVENGAGPVALAAAALDQNTRGPVQELAPTVFQCHKCHWKKTRRDPTPPPAPPQRDVSVPLAPTPVAVSAPAPEAAAPQTVPHYPWPSPSPYPPPSNYNPWPRPSTAPQGVGLISQYNGSHSPHANNGQFPQPNGQPQLRQPVQVPPPSPHQNGHSSQRPNGYPSSPHHGLGPAALHTPNGGYTSYASTRPSPQHLTNGVPPPHPPEQPFTPNHIPVHHRPSYGPLLGSPPMLHESHPQGHPQNHPPGHHQGHSQGHLAGHGISHPQNNNARPNDGRVNGGASASPSLRNLLS